jgi:Acetyltransferase (GNAT) domain
LTNNLRRLDVVRAFHAPPRLSNGGLVQIARAHDAWVDLSKGSEAIYARMRVDNRYQVRRAEKMRNRFEIVMNTEAAQADFLVLYNAFARSKEKLLPPLTPRRFSEYLPHGDVFMLYFEGQPTCGRLVLRDEESHTALMMYSGTRRLEQGADIRTISILNRYLHWHEMKTYQAAGMQEYNFGGVGPQTPSVNDFKMSFGAQLRPTSWYLCAGAARPVWRIAYSLYTKWANGSLRYTTSASEASESKDSFAKQVSGGVECTLSAPTQED